MNLQCVGFGFGGVILGFMLGLYYANMQEEEILWEDIPDEYKSEDKDAFTYEVVGFSEDAEIKVNPDMEDRHVGYSDLHDEEYVDVEYEEPELGAPEEYISTEPHFIDEQEYHVEDDNAKITMLYYPIDNVFCLEEDEVNALSENDVEEYLGEELMALVSRRDASFVRNSSVGVDIAIYKQRDKGHGRDVVDRKETPKERERRLSARDTKGRFTKKETE
jgi:hypothetical protein